MQLIKVLMHACGRRTHMFAGRLQKRAPQAMRSTAVRQTMRKPQPPTDGAPCYRLRLACVEDTASRDDDASSHSRAGKVGLGIVHWRKGRPVPIVTERQRLTRGRTRASAVTAEDGEAAVA